MTSIKNQTSHDSAGTRAKRGVAILAGAAVLSGKATAAILSKDQLTPGLPVKLQGTLKTLPAQLRPGQANINLVRARAASAVPGLPSDAFVGGTTFAASKASVHAPFATSASAEGSQGGRRLLGLGSKSPPPTPPTVNALPPSTGKLITSDMAGCPTSDYATKATIGSQSFQVIVDSGSTTLAIASSKCTDCDDVSPSYRPGSGAKDKGKSVEGDYGSGKWVGEVYSDSVTFAGGPKVTMTFGAIDDQQDFITNNGCDLTSQDGTKPLASGLMGVGPEDLLLDNTQSYVGLTNSSWSYPAMSFANCDAGGSFFLGGYPSANANGEAFFTPMLQNPYYSIPMVGIGINGTSSGATLNDLGYSIVDTGSTAIMLPEPVYQAIAGQIDQLTNGFITQDFFDQGACAQWNDATVADVQSQLPPMTFELASAQNTSQAFFLSNGAAHSYLTAQDADGGAVICPVLVNTGTGGGAQTLLGNTMMRNFVTVFDIKGNQIGFTPSKGICAATK